MNQKNEYGNPLAIIHEDEKLLTQDHRQQVAKKIGYSETGFIYDLESGGITLFNPVAEVGFSGHALLGLATYIKEKTGESPTELKLGGITIETFEADERVWVRASKKLLPEWNFVQMEHADDVEAVSIHNNQRFSEHTYVWAWMDSVSGLIRARTFAPDWGIVEDEANGSGTMMLALMLGKDLTVQHGQGSIVFARPETDDIVALGGRVADRGRVAIDV